MHGLVSASLFITCKHSPSQAVVWEVDYATKKATRLLFFKCVIYCCMRESVCVLKDRASERRRMFYIVFVKRAENENMGKRDDEREREDKQWCTTDIRSPHANHEMSEAMVASCTNVCHIL